MSPYLFAIYIDGLVDKIRNCAFGCYIRNVCMAILLYADDILLIAPSVTSFQMLLHICDHELSCIKKVKVSICIAHLAYNASNVLVVTKPSRQPHGHHVQPADTG